MVEAESHVGRLAAIKEAGREAGVDVVLNSRVDVFLHDGEVDEAGPGAATVRRRGCGLRYPICVKGRDAIGRLVEEVGAPLNILAVPGGLSLAELSELGVARVSFGSGLMHIAMDAAAQVAADYSAG